MKNRQQNSGLIGRYLCILFCSFFIVSPASAGLAGKTISTEFNWPNKKQVAFGGVALHKEVGDGVEIAGSPQGFPIAGIDFSDSSITIKFTRNGVGTRANFNGWRFFDADNSLPDFTNVTLTGANNFDWEVSFDANNIWLNGEAKRYQNGMTLVLDVELGHATKENSTSESMTTDKPAQLNPIWDKKIKAWEYEQNYFVKRGDLGISLQKLRLRNAPENGFIADVRDSRYSVFANFTGACDQVVEVTARVNSAKDYDLAAYVASPSSKKLPTKDAIQFLRKALTEQCDDLQVIRIQYMVSIHLDQYKKVAPGSMEMPLQLAVFDGTMTKDSGWKIQEGHVKTAYDHTQTFTLNYRDVFSVAGVKYTGGCQDDPVFAITNLYRTPAEKTFAKMPTLSTMSAVAREYSGMYAKKCPSTQKVRFTIANIPEGYACPETSDCYIYTTLKDGRWEFDNSRFKRGDTYIKDANDLFDVLAAGEFGLLPDYTDFFNFYFEQWFGAYYHQCSDHIVNPVSRRYTVISVTEDAYGMEIAKETIVDQEINLESQYAEVYDKIFGTSHTWVKVKMLQIYMDQKSKGRSPTDVARSTLGFFTSNVSMINKLLANSCTSDKVLTAQQNMMNFARGLPAIKGKYSIDK